MRRPASRSTAIATCFLASGVALGAACEGEGDGFLGFRRGQPPDTIVSQVRLRSFVTCDGLEKHIEDGMVDEMRAALAQQLRGGGLEAGGVFGGAADRASAAPPSATAGGSKSAAPVAYTKTNVQVAGVDEADFVKNDGTRIFVLSGQRLYATQSWPPQDLAVRASLEIEGEPREMFLDETRNRLVVISEVFTPYPASSSGSGGVSAPFGGGAGSAPGGTGAVPATSDIAPCLADARLAPGGGCGGAGETTTKATVIDIGNLAAPAAVEAYYLPGGYVASRRVDSSVRIVQAQRLDMPPEVRLYVESADPTLYSDKRRLQAAFDWIGGQNERVIRARSLEQWIPRPRFRRTSAAQAVPIAYDCTDFAYSNVPVRSGLVTVATLNLDAAGTQVARTTVLGEPGQVYASRTALYVASPHWWWWPADAQRSHTYVHKFDISQPDRAVYRGSGGVEGAIGDQFALDEHEGALRVATTIDTWRVARGGGLGMETASQVTVLGERAGSLVALGKTPALAPGERITSARFAGTRGFVVTFRQVDPLFTFDLSDPSHPRKVGELKVPGFSTYIHPLDENHLLTIGVYVPEPDPSGRVAPVQRSLKLSLFDVSNFARPREAFTELIGTSAADSEALGEHRAFNYFPERKLLAIPFSDYARSGGPGTTYWDGFVSELRVFGVDAQRGFTRRGSLSMKDCFQRIGNTAWSGGYTPWVRRSVMAADAAGNDFVYAISDAGVRVANLASIASPLGTAYFNSR